MDFAKRFAELFEMARTDTYSRPAVEGLASFVADPSCPEDMAGMAGDLLESQLVNANSDDELSHYSKATGG